MSSCPAEKAEASNSALTEIEARKFVDGKDDGQTSKLSPDSRKDPVRATRGGPL